MPSVVDCRHANRVFIASEQGPNERRAYASVCRNCGLFTVSLNNERMTFALVSDEQVAAASQYATYLKEAANATHT